MSELTVTLNLTPQLDRRLKEEAERSGVPLPAYVSRALAERHQMCPVCGYEGPGVRVLDFDGAGGTCACPPTEDDERWLASLAAQGR
jgi:hypothetical protein